jgi:hypothetical protein
MSSSILVAESLAGYRLPRRACGIRRRNSGAKENPELWISQPGASLTKFGYSGLSFLSGFGFSLFF